MAKKMTRSISARVRELEALVHRNQLGAEGLEALAEGCFRAASMTDTAPTEAVRLLRRAIRYDGTNPKYAYLLARIYLVNGDFDNAGRWLREAARHCPTSHRIWSHIALVQRELNSRYRGNDAYEPDDLRLRSAEVLRRVRLGSDFFTAELLDFQPRESTKKKQERLEKRSVRFEDEPDEDDSGNAEPEKKSQSDGLHINAFNRRRFTDPGTCRWSGAADLALEGILEGTVSELNCQRGLPLLRQAAHLATMRRGGTAAFAILGIEWCVAGFPVETVERLRRTFPPSLDLPSLRLLDFVCRCFRIPEVEVSAALSDALTKSLVPPTLAAILHHRRLLYQSLDARVFVRHGAGRRWLVRHRSDANDVTDVATEMARALTQAAASFAPKQSSSVGDSAAPPQAPADWLDALAPIEDAATDLAKIFGEAAATVAHGEDCAELVRALEEAAERTSVRLDDLLAAAFETAPRDAFRVPAASCRRVLNRLLYTTPFAARFPAAPGGDRSSSQASPEIARFCAQANAILATEASELDTPTVQLAALEEGARESKSHLDGDWKTLNAHLQAKNKGGLTEEAVAECFAVAARVEQITANAGERIREIADLRATGKLHEWTPAEVHAAKLQSLVDQKGNAREFTNEEIEEARDPLPSSQVKRLNEAERSWRELTTSQGRFRRIIAQLALPKQQIATPAAVQQSEGAPPTPQPPEIEEALDGIPAVERALSHFAEQVEKRFITALRTFDDYTPAQLDEPALAALRWSVRARQAEALFRLGQKAAARRVWAQLLREDRLSVPVLKNVAVALTGSAETGRELNAWRDYAEMLYFQDCVRHSPRPHSAARAAFHKDFGANCAPEFFAATKRDGDLTEADETSLVSFVGSPARVRAYVAHKRLEWFNRKLNFASPTLVLGCDRNESENIRSVAGERLLAFADASSSLLPQRARENFLRLSRGHIDDAIQNCKDYRRILEDTAYAIERPSQLKWIAEVLLLKLRIGGFILKSKELPRRLTSPEFLDELLLLDEVPIDLSPRFLTAVQFDLKLEYPPEMLVRFMSVVRDNFFQAFTSFLGEEDGDEALRRLREKQISRLADDWLELQSVRGSMPVIKFFINRLEAAAASGQHERACQTALIVIRADDRNANVAQLGLVKFIEAAEASRRCLYHRELASETDAWMKRARHHLATHEPEEDEQQPLTAQAITDVGDALILAITAVFLAPHIDVKADERKGRLEAPLEELVREHPMARPGRMVKYMAFASDAQTGPREDLVHWVRLCKADVDAVLSDQRAPAKYRKLASEFKTQIQKAGI